MCYLTCLNLFDTVRYCMFLLHLQSNSLVAQIETTQEVTSWFPNVIEDCNRGYYYFVVVSFLCTIHPVHLHTITLYTITPSPCIPSHHHPVSVHRHSTHPALHPPVHCHSTHPALHPPVHCHSIHPVHHHSIHPVHIVTPSTLYTITPSTLYTITPSTLYTVTPSPPHMILLAHSGLCYHAKCNKLFKVPSWRCVHTKSAM